MSDPIYAEVLPRKDMSMSQKSVVTIEDLTPATWYFAVKAVNSAGAQSSFSNEAWKTIN